jgi:predicted site-specific integrase-resolvase
MERFCIARGLAVDEWLTEIGGGMDLTRRTFLAVMDAIERGEIATLVIAHQDRLARFGFDYLEHVATNNDCDIVVANQQALSPDQELVHDLVAVVHTFSGRLSGLRRYEKTLKKTLKDELGDGAR